MREEKQDTCRAGGKGNENFKSKMQMWFWGNVGF